MGDHLIFNILEKESPARHIFSSALVPQCILFLLFFFCFVSESSAQRITVSGQVRDSSTELPLQFANVFVNNTTINTVTDAQGKYSLTGISPGTYELVVSYVGYVTQNRNIELQSANNPIIDFRLEPKEDDLEEIDVTSRMDKKWGKQLKRFEKVFIGNPMDSIAGASKILNPWVLDFGEGKASNGPRYFYATAQEPIQIENSALGYRIFYDLLDFKQTRNGFNYLGLSRFEEMEPSSKDIAELWHENRQRVFFGSTRHLLKTIIEKDTVSKEYQVYKVNPFPVKHERTNVFFRELGNSLELVPIDSITIQDSIPGRNLLVSDAMLEAHYIKGIALNNFYRDIKFPISWLTFKNDTLIVDPNGVPLDPAQLILSGQMAEDRMGRFLPLDFQPDVALAYLQQEANFVEDPNKWNSLREKPFVQTDKSYYYPGETIWFKSNMMYQNPIMADSLSQVLYVEVFSDIKELAATGTFSITKGSSNGQLKLPNDLPKGNYGLRAYTNWMRNFGDADFFYQAIPVLDLNEKVIGPVASNLEPEIEPEIEVQIIPENVQLVPGGKNSVTLKLLDSYGEPVAAELSVSVQNSNLVANISGDPKTGAASNWLLEPEMITPSDSLEYPIEYGIAFSGQFLNRKDRPEKANITIVQGKYDDYGVVETDSLGRFWANGLYFTDSAEIAIAAFDDKLRRYGSIILDEKSIPTLTGSFPEIDLQIENTQSKQREYILEDMAGFITLEEVIVEDEKIEPLRERNYGYGNGDYSYTEKDLEKYLHLTLGEFLNRFNVQSNRNWGLKTGGKLYIVDGVKQDPESGGVDVPLSEVASISIFTNSSPVFGMAGFAGAVMITTKTGGRFVDDPEKKILEKNLFQLFTMGGFTKEQKFPDFENSTQNRSLIDYQPTVHWNPSLQTDPETGEVSFSFYSGEMDTTYRIVIQGLTEENIPFRVVKEMRVLK